MPEGTRRFFEALIFTIAGCGLLYGANVLFAATAPAHPFFVLLLGVLCAFLGAAILLYGATMHAAALGHIDLLHSLYRAVGSFFNQGVFYIVLGCLFLFAAYRSLGEVHSAFVFLITILGFAIVLYGTGTQAAGTGSTGGWNVAIAGGAGVLAAVFGYGIVWKGPEIQQVFKGNVDYGVVEISNSDVSSLDFQRDYDVTAELTDGSRLHLWRKLKGMEIIVPIRNPGEPSRIILNLNPRTSYADRDDKTPKSIAVDWKGTPTEQELGNERRRRVERALALLQVPKLATEVPANQRSGDARPAAVPLLALTPQ